MKECLVCKSEKIVRDVTIVDKDEYSKTKPLKVLHYTKPNALIFRGGNKFDLTSDICGECGFVAVRLKNPKGLWAAHEEYARNNM